MASTKAAEPKKDSKDNKADDDDDKEEAKEPIMDRVMVFITMHQ